MPKLYEVNIEVSLAKIFKVQAESSEEARDFILETYLRSNLINMEKEDATQIYVDSMLDEGGEYCECYFDCYANANSNENENEDA